MKQGIFNLYKLPGETPLERLGRFKAAHPEYESERMTYAGRLDPLAEGVLIALAGEARFRKDEFLALPKTYEFEILLGLSSDTHDALGIIEADTAYNLNVSELEPAIRRIIPRFVGEIEQAYPLYSSRTLRGVPLFTLARSGAINASDVPRKKVFIHSLDFLDSRIVAASDILPGAKSMIGSVRGDFRQEAARNSWRKALEAQLERTENFSLLHFSATVSSGTYIRVLADSLGKALGTHGIAWKIVRTAVGEHLIANSIKDEFF